MEKIVSLTEAKNKPKRLMDVLNKLMSETSVNISQLSKNTSLANTTVKRMCTDPHCNPTLTSITRISDFFGITPNQLIGTEHIHEDSASYYPNFKEWGRVPILKLDELLSWPDNIEGISESPLTKYIMTDIEVQEETFAIVSKDDALEPKFSEGTVLIFDPKRTPKNKDFVVLLMENKKLPQFRQVLIDGPDIYIKTINPAFGNTTGSCLPKDKFKILGILIQAKSNYS